MSGSLAALNEFPFKGQSFTARWGLSAANLGNKAYVFGGYIWFHGVEGFFQDIYELDLSTSTVRRIPTDASCAPPKRFGHTLVADPSQNRLLLFGGRNTVESFGDVWAFNVEGHVWTQLQCTVAGSKTDAFSKSSSLCHLNSMSTASEESPSTKKSDKRSSKKEKDSPKNDGPPPRSWHTAALYRNSLYVCGGWDHYNRVFNDLWALDLSTNVWSKIDPSDPMCKPPTGRSCHQTAVWGDYLYIFGGLRDGDSTIGDMWRFSFETRTWAPVDCCGTKPTGRTSAAGAVVNDSWVIHGGLTEFPRTGMVAIPDVLEFHFPTSTWIPRVTMSSDGAASSGRRYGHAAILIPNSSTLVFLGGAEKYATACLTPACRIDLLPGQFQVTDIQTDITNWTRVSQINRDRVAELVEVVQNFDLQMRQLKAENAALQERSLAIQSQMGALHQQQAALQTSFQNVQAGLGEVEQFIPMMKSVGAAIANFGTVAGARSGWSAPASNASLGRSSAGNLSGTLQTSGE